MADDKAQLTDDAVRVLQARYLRRDRDGQVVETLEGMFRRMAHSVAQAGAKFGDSAAAGRCERALFDALFPCAGSCAREFACAALP